MLFPVLFLVFGRTILDQPALATHKPVIGRSIPAVGAALRSFTALCVLRYIFVETDVAVDPVAHLPRSYLPPVSTTALYRQYRRTFDATTRKAYHLAVVVTARVRTTAWKVKEYVF